MNEQEAQNLMNGDQKQRFAEALERVAGDEDILVMLATIAAEDAPPLLGNLEAAIDRNEFAAAAKTAHSLKGLLSAFETGEPVCELQPLTDAARKDEHDECLAIHNAIQPKLKSLVEEIKAVANG